MKKQHVRPILLVSIVGASAFSVLGLVACSSDDDFGPIADGGVGPTGDAAADGARADGGAVDAGAVDASAGDAPVMGIDSGPDALAHTGPLVAYASGYGSNIGVFGVDETSGALSAKAPVAAFAANPTFLAINGAAKHLYAAAEVGSGRVGAYSIDAKTGALAFLNDVSSEGSGPAHVSVDVTGKHVFVANYSDGEIAVLPVLASGGLGLATDHRFAGANAHQIVIDATNKFVFVPCLGDDLIAQYRFDASTGKLTPNTPPSVATANGAGPRHIAFHPSAPFAYAINEKDSTMNAYAFDTTAGTLAEIDSESTRAIGASGNNTTAEVWVHPSGKFLYGSNRGDDSIVVFSLDAAGKMTRVDHTSTGGATPRSFTLDPAGKFLYAANQASGDLRVFTIDAALGTLTSTGSPTAFPSPSFIGVVRLP